MRLHSAFTIPFLVALVTPTAVWARGGGGCLEEGTPILTPAGPVAIERLHPGDVVWCVQGKHRHAATVQARIEVQPAEYLELAVAGCVLRVTAEHPFQVAPGVFRQADRLVAGDPLWVDEQGSLRAVPLRSVRRVSAQRPAYNLLVSPGGTYLANGVVAHNKGCFLPETPILRADGTTTAISAVQPGDELLAFTPEGTVVRTTVRKVRTHEVGEYILVTTEHVRLRVTPEHPFYVGDGTFQTLETLRIGDRVFAYDGHGLSAQPITGIEHVYTSTHVYNLQTDAPHTFFANGIAVHNKGGGGGGGGGFGGGGGWGGGYHSSSGSSHGNAGFGDANSQNLIIAAIIGAFLGIVFWGVGGKRDNVLGYFVCAPVGAVAGVVVVLMGCFAAAIVVFAVMAIIGSLTRKTSKTEQDLDFVYSPAAVAKKAGKTQKLLEFLARQDDSVKPEALRQLADSTFRTLQECWQSRSYEPMQPLLMPDLYAQHCAQLQGLARNHERNLIADLQVERIDLVHLRYTHKADQREFTALITARARDYYVDDRTGAFLRGDRAPARFQEFWTFHRQGDAWLLREVEQSRESDVLKEENFVEQFTDQQVQAVYHDTAGTEGPAGPWLEAEVETKATRIERMLNFLVQTDKLWDKKLMVERARQVFTDVYLAQEAGDPAVVKAADLFPEVAAHLQEEIRRRQAEGRGVENRNLCVRKVELVLVRNFAGTADDEFVTRISAHAQRVFRKHGSVLRQDEYVTPFEEYWTFGRHEGQWKLKEVLPPARGQQLVGAENVDQDSTPEQVQWYYRHTRAG